MNIPWKVSDTASQVLGATQQPIPVVGAPYQTPDVDVRGYDWVEFHVTWAGNAGVSPSTTLHAKVLYGDAASGMADLTSESVDVAGLATQAVWKPLRDITGLPAGAWRIPVPVHGALMRLEIYGDATPDALSTLSISVYRRSF